MYKYERKEFGAHQQNCGKGPEARRAERRQQSLEREARPVPVGVWVSQEWDSVAGLEVGSVLVWSLPSRQQSRILFFF